MHVYSFGTCGLTAEDRDQLRNPTLVSNMGLPLIIIIIIIIRARFEALPYKLQIIIPHDV